MVYIDHAKALACAPELLRQNAIPAPHSTALIKAAPAPLRCAAAEGAAAGDGAASDGGEGGAEAPRTPEGSDGEEEEREAAEAAVGTALASAKL